MTVPALLPANEAERLAALRAHAILDTPAEQAFDQLAQLAAQVCGTPMGIVNFVDEKRQWFKAAVGLSVRETERTVAFCAHWIDGRRGVIEIPDAQLDPRFRRNPLVLGEPHIRFYACVPLVTADGLALGTLMVLDTQPRTLSLAQHTALEALAQQTMAQLELRQVNHELAWSEERFLHLAQATTDAVWDWNLTANTLWWSDSVRSLLGLAPEQPLPDFRTWVEHIHPDDYPLVMEALKSTIKGRGVSWSAEYCMQRTDGTSLWVLDRGAVIRNAQGRAVRMVGGIKNISAEKQAHLAALQEAQTHAELVRVQQQMSSPALDQAGLLDLVVHAALQATGASAAVVEWVVGDMLVNQAGAGPLARPVGSMQKLADYALWADLQRGGPVLRSDRASSALATPVRVDGVVMGVLTLTATGPDAFSTRDGAHIQMLTESLGALMHLRQIAGRLRASEQQYRQLFDAHPQPMWVYALDGDLRLLAVNHAMVRLYGYSEAELLQLRMCDLLLPAERAVWQAAILSDPYTDRTGMRHTHVCKDGQLLEVEVYSRSIEFNGHAARQVMVNDITDRLRAERELQRLGRAQRLLSACNEAMVRATAEPALLQSICRIAVDIGGYRFGWVGLARDDADKTIEPVAYAGDHANYLETIDLSWSSTDPRGHGPAGTTVRTGQPVIVQDVHSDPAYAGLSDRMLAQGFHGVISLPLRQGEHTFGLIYLYAPEVLHISADETRLLQDLANDLAFGISSLRARAEHQRMQTAVLKVAAAVSGATGTGFLVQLVTQMTEVFDAQAGGVMRLLPRHPGQSPRVLGLATILDGRLSPPLEYSLEGTPAMALLEQRQIVVPHSASELYPNAPFVASGVPVQAYVGQQLRSSNGEPIGHVFVLFTRPLDSPGFVTSTLQIFAARAAAEIERQVADTRIRQQASLLDKAQDAIVVHGLDQRITYWNKSAERVYGWSQEEALGQSLVELLRYEPTLFEQATQTVLTQGEWTGENVQHHRDGHAIDMEGRWTLVSDDAGRPESILSISTDIRQRKATEREIQRLAFYDALTGLPNRMLLMDRIHHALASAKRNHQGGALLFIDMDNFKTLNDTLGHDQGDLLLQQVAQRLNTCVRAVDTVARLGGDEFVVMLEALSSDPDTLAILARGVGEKILATLAVPYELVGYQYRSTPSIGIAPFDGDSTSVGDLLKQADLAMYQSKAAGRNTLHFFDPHMQAVVTARAALEFDLRTALSQQQFLLHYQLQVDQHGRYTGAEALVRWAHPERGMVSPAEFIPVAEDTGMVLALGHWVLETACRLLADWHRQPALAHMTMAVNVSSRQFRHAGFVDDVAQLLRDTGAPAHLLKLELTESLLVEDMEATIAIMTAVRGLGVGFSLDDFGTGYSSLSYLKRMPLDQLKIDQSFVRDLLTDPNDAAIVHTIIGLSRSLGLTVIAEGVETIEQRDVLFQAGCAAFQGYLFGRPLPEAQLRAFLQAAMH